MARRSPDVAEEALQGTTLRDRTPPGERWRIGVPNDPQLPNASLGGSLGHAETPSSVLPFGAFWQRLGGASGSPGFCGLSLCGLRRKASFLFPPQSAGSARLTE
jgi:hypothetical protein